MRVWRTRQSAPQGGGLSSSLVVCGLFLVFGVLPAHADQINLGGSGGTYAIEAVERLRRNPRFVVHDPKFLILRSSQTLQRAPKQFFNTRYWVWRVPIGTPGPISGHPTRLQLLLTSVSNEPIVSSFCRSSY